MLKFFLGLVVGAVLGAGGMYLWHHRHHPAPRRGKSPDVVVVSSAAKKPHKVDHGGPSAPSGSGAIAIGPDDLKVIGDGDTLTRHTTIDVSGNSDEPRDLSPAEVDGAFVGANDSLVACVTAARGEAPVSGTVTVGILVAPDGSVEKSRVDAPSYLVKHGIYGCAKGKLAGLKFPATGGEVVVTKTYTID